MKLICKLLPVNLKNTEVNFRKMKQGIGRKMSS